MAIRPLKDLCPAAVLLSATAQPHAMIARHKHGGDQEQVWLDGTPTRL
ncbi:MAG: hypothetical protein NTX37_10075 [Burkholderiales bacterium]|nr:hypothetical protein [Burkholderiales bacterium]